MKTAGIFALVVVAITAILAFFVSFSMVMKDTFNFMEKVIPK